MGRAAVPPTNCTAAPYGPVQGARGWVWWRNGWFAYYKLTSEQANEQMSKRANKLTSKRANKQTSE